MSPFNKSAGSIVTHSFLALELCGSLDAHKHTMENTAPPAQNIHKTSQNTRLSLVKTEINNMKCTISRGQRTPKHRQWTAQTTSVSWTGKGKEPGLWMASGMDGMKATQK